MTVALSERLEFHLRPPNRPVSGLARIRLATSIWRGAAVPTPRQAASLEALFTSSPRPRSSPCDQARPRDTDARAGGLIPLLISSFATGRFCRRRAGSAMGTAASSRLVYGCCGFWKIASRGPVSCNAVADTFDHSHVVRYEQIGKAHLRLQVEHEIDHLGLDRHVERRHGLVRYDQLGSSTSARALQMRWRWPPENSCG